MDQKASSHPKYHASTPFTGSTSSLPTARGTVRRPGSPASRLVTALLLSIPLTWGCGARTSEQRGGESHFLQSCDADDCGSGFECVGGICTQSCESDATCAPLQESSSCVNRDGRSVCDLECESHDQCETLGGRFACFESFCRAGEPLDPPVDSSSAGPDIVPDASAPDAAVVPTSTRDVPPMLDGGALDAATPTSPTGDATSTDPTEISGCRYAFVNYEEGDEVPSGSCETCVCQSDQVVCEPTPDADCEEYGLPVVPCPDPQDIRSDDIDVQFAYVDGDSLIIDATHSTGCAPHNYAVCYGSFLESDPVQSELRLIHDAHGDTCEALASPQLRFDLRPLATEYSTNYATDNGVIVTQFGTFAFGPLACEDRAVAASAQLYNAIAQLDLSCGSDLDCEIVPVTTDCFEACDAVVSLRESHFVDGAASSSKQLLERELTRIDDSCADFATECGAPESGVACAVLDGCPVACDEGNTARCIDSVCQLRDE